ncbi:hypothetical protein HD599_000403 [Conyzicola lurida]|uniref:Uncharacterized protein n=1 Tax=Conyzicola lurida TaxID=1172621 RepID=A0A841AEB7_9MICO|nr:hypothetical protein [Conyzicola lurida]MBB5842080.1 hypothetical protein [Conyzicola lurida]
MRSPRAQHAAVAALVILACAACTPGAAEPAASPTPSATVDPTTEPTAEPTLPPGGESYGTLEELRVALTGAGIDCPSLVDPAGIPDATESGWCPDYQWGLSIYPTVEARNHVLQLNVDSQEPQPFLVGTNWLLASASQYPLEELGQVGGVLGGIVWQSPEPFPE